MDSPDDLFLVSAYQLNDMGQMWMPDVALGEDAWFFLRKELTYLFGEPVTGSRTRSTEPSVLERAARRLPGLPDRRALCLDAAHVPHLEGHEPLHETGPQRQRRRLAHRDQKVAAVQGIPDALARADIIWSAQFESMVHGLTTTTRLDRRPGWRTRLGRVFRPRTTTLTNPRW